MYSSSFLCHRSKGPLSFSFNDNSYLLADRFGKYPLAHSSSSSCCCGCSCCCARPTCCGHSNYAVSISPSLLYGLRQSSLLQWSASRRLYFGGGDRYYCRLPVHGIDREVSDLYEEVPCARTNGGRRRRIKCMGSEDKYQTSRLSCFEDVEAVLSLLSEEVGEECFDSRGKRGSSSFKRYEVQKKTIYGSEHTSGRKKKGSILKEINSKSKLKSIEIESRDDDRTQNNGRGDFRKEDNRKAKKKASSCSSYHSFSSSGGFGSDIEEIKDDGFVGETSSSHLKEPRRREKSKTNSEMLEEDRIYGEEREENGMLEKKKAMVRSNVEWDWRKKSEKKLNEQSAEEAQCQSESFEGCSTMSRTYDYDDKKSSISRIPSVEKKSIISANLDSRASIGHRQNENKDVNIFELERKSKMSQEVCRACGSEVLVSHQSAKQLHSREEKVMASSSSIKKKTHESMETAGHAAERDEFAGNTREFPRKLEIQEMDTEETSSLHRKSRRHDWEADAILGSRLALEREEKSHKDDQITIEGKIGKSQQFTEQSESNHTAERMSIIQSNRINLQQKTNVVSYSYPSEREQHHHTDSQALQLAHSSGWSQDDMHKSKFRASHMETAHSSQRTSEERMASPDTNLISVVTLSGEGQDRQKESRGKVIKTESGSGGMSPRLTKQSSSYQKVVERPPNYHNINLVYQQNVQVVNQEANTVTSQSLLTPPPSQLVARGSSYVDKTSEVPTEEISLESDLNTLSTHRETQTSAFNAQVDSGGRRHGNRGESLYVRTHEDALGSAIRMEESSGNFVGEYIERARREMSSEAEVDTSDAKSGYSSKDNVQASSPEYGSEDVQLKNRDSRHPSGSSGSKGPSDEIWHEIDPSIHEVLKSEEPDGSTKSGPVSVGRSGRSLWNIMANIVRLRWGSRAESSTSAARSGGKSTMNESVSSDTWFSGHEREENIGDNVKQETSAPQKVTSSDQLQPLHSLTRNRMHSLRGEKRTPSEVQIVSPVKSGSSSAKMISLSSAQQEEDSHWHEIAQDTNIPPLALDLVESSLPQPPKVATPPRREASSDTGMTHIAGSGLCEGLDQNAEKLIEVGGVEVTSSQLKQRKFQRAKQVTRDRFDEWEEAYRLESEHRRIDEIFMREALVEAKKAAEKWEVPVGAVLVQHGKIIARGYNLVEELRDSTAHAEMICIKEASNVLQSWRLAETTLYVTLEPCPMCAGAILQARVDTLVWGAPNKLLGADGSWVRLFPISEGATASEGTDKPAPPIHPFHPKMTIRRGVLEPECADAMQQFFQLRRKKKEKKSETSVPPSCLPISPHPSKLLNKMHDMFHLMFCL